jgi:hypothetical protein
MTSVPHIPTLPIAWASRLTEQPPLTDLPTTTKRWSGWKDTPEAEDLLRKLYPDGHSFSVLAAEIGRVYGRGLERNAVISKAHRIKLPPRGDHNGKQRAERLRHRREGLSAAPKDRRLTNNNPPKPKPPLKVERPKPVVEVEPLLVPLLDLRAGDCHWIVGDRAPWLYCGHPAGIGTSWCRWHAKLVYREPYRNETVARLERIASAP